MNVLLYRPIAVQRGRSLDPSFKYIRDTVNKNYFRRRARVIASADTVSPNHLLVRILQSLGLNRRLTLDELHYAMTERMYQLANAMNITSATNYGTTHTNVMLDGAQEIIVFHNTEFEPSAWESMCPVKFLYHCETNLDTRLGGNKTTDTLAFISINIPMLAYQYIMWAKAVRRAESTENTLNFVAKYVMYNAVQSYMNISYFNRIYNELAGKPEIKYPPFREIPLANIDGYVAKNIKFNLAKFGGGARAISQYLYQIQLPFADSGFDLTEEPDLVKNRQCMWAMDMFQLPFIHFGLLAAKMTESSIDSGKLSTWWRHHEQMRDTRVLERLPTQFSTYIYRTFEENIYQLIEEA